MIRWLLSRAALHRELAKARSAWRLMNDRYTELQVEHRSELAAWRAAAQESMQAEADARARAAAAELELSIARARLGGMV